VSVREAALALVATSIAAITGIVTTVREFDLDIRSYSQAQLPLFFLKTPDPRFQFQPGMRLQDKSELLGTLYYIDWTESATIMEGWIEKIVEGINVTPTAKAILDWQDTPTKILDMTFPLYAIEFKWIMNSYASQSDF
jgi:predicted transcriptional regulator of viral defense system